MTEKEKILIKLKKYIKLVRTQEASDGEGLWAGKCEVSLISGAKLYKGAEEIMHNFLLGVIREKYLEIDLITDSVELRPLNERSVLVIFSYRTDCIQRETGEPYGIYGLETQIYVKEEGDWRLAHVQYSGRPVDSTARF